MIPCHDISATVTVNGGRIRLIPVCKSDDCILWIRRTKTFKDVEIIDKRHLTIIDIITRCYKNRPSGRSHPLSSKIRLTSLYTGHLDHR